MPVLEWAMGFLGFVVIAGGVFMFWRGLSLRPHKPDQARPPERHWW